METKWKMEPIVFKHPDNPIVVFSNLVDLQNKEKAVLSRLDEIKMEHPRWLYYIISLTEGADSSFVIGQPLGMMAYSKLKKISENMEKHVIVHVSVSPVVEGRIEFTLKDDEKEASYEEITKEDIEAINSSNNFDFIKSLMLGVFLGLASKNNDNEEEENSEDD